MGNAIEPSSLLVVGMQDVPRCVLRIGSVEHLVASARVFVPAFARRQVDRAKFPLSQGVVDPRLKSLLLFFVGDFEPVLKQNDAAVDDVLFDLRAQFQEVTMLLFRAEAHHVLDPGAVVPAAVKNHDLAGGWEMLHVPLHVHLALFPIRRSRQRDNAKHARADALGEGPDRPAFTGAVASFEHDDDSQSFCLYPGLERAKLALKSPQFRLVLLA